MIDDIERRRKYWDDKRNRAPHDFHDLTDSDPYPFAKVERMFRGKDVLEIGPGRGRQYERLKGIVKSYSIADISSDALCEPVFDQVQGRFLIEDYGEPFGRFDVVHFWYVLHHVKIAELEPFFSFVASLLRDDGAVFFNSPHEFRDGKWYRNDGLGTTWIGKDQVLDIAGSYLDFFLVDEVNERSTGCIFGAKKIK